jgi:hypothetical protein
MTIVLTAYPFSTNIMMNADAMHPLPTVRNTVFLPRPVNFDGDIGGDSDWMLS